MQALSSVRKIRIFEQQQSLEAAPLKIITVDDAGLAEWHPTQEILAGPSRDLKYLLRAYDSNGNFDETDARPLRVYREQLLGSVVTSDGAVKPRAGWPPTARTIWRASRFRSAAAR